MNKVKKIILSLLIMLAILLAASWWFNLPYRKKIGSNFVTVYCVKGKPEFKAEYVIVTRSKKQTIIEIIMGPGLKNVVRLEGEKAECYLYEMGLD